MGIISKNLVKRKCYLEIRGRIDTIHTTALLKLEFFEASGRLEEICFRISVKKET